jgi:hypothetical protein
MSSPPTDAPAGNGACVARANSGRLSRSKARFIVVRNIAGMPRGATFFSCQRQDFSSVIAE